MQITVPMLFDKPDHYLHEFQEEMAVFVGMDREAYHRSIFLDGRIQPAREGVARVPAEPVAAWRDRQGLAIPAKNWIFHVANCGSTLLARALDRLHDSLVLREPYALRQLGVDRGWLDPAARPLWEARLRLVLTQYGKRFDADAPVVIKANVPVNFLLDALLPLEPQSNAIYLYLPLEDYFAAILRSDGHKNWVMRVTDELAPALRPIADVARLSVAERAAALWLGQLTAFAKGMSLQPQARSLDARAFFADPRRTVAEAAALFGVALSERSLDAVMGGTLFQTYAKNPQRAFTEAERAERAAATRAALADEIAVGRRFVEAQGSRLGLPDRLERPLFGDAPPLV